MCATRESQGVSRVALGERDRMTKLEKIRQAFADYRRAEGCSCCRDIEAHQAAAARLGALLDIPKYPGTDDYNFGLFESPDNGNEAS